MKTLCCFFLIVLLSEISFAKKISVPVIYSYPTDKAILVHPATDIGFSFPTPIEKKSLLADKIDVFGTSGKQYPGIFKLSSNGKTVIYTPSEPFGLGESIVDNLRALETINGKPTLPFSQLFFPFLS